MALLDGESNTEGPEHKPRTRPGQGNANVDGLSRQSWPWKDTSMEQLTITEEVKQRDVTRTSEEEGNIIFTLSCHIILVIKPIKMFDALSQISYLCFNRQDS